ncbi:MAG: 2-oxo acid dehydrogenase subunit E2 [Spirochaetales bacterium]|nr:2-oxo acid dehydrogenase subunit E2 [Spirochaetales bacterium]
MKKEVVLPEIAENITSGEVLAVLIAVGDTIKKDQSLIEVETEKAAMEIPSPIDGTVTDISVKIGDTINVGGVLCIIETESAETLEIAEKSEQTTIFKHTTETDKKDTTVIKEQQKEKKEMIAGSIQSMPKPPDKSQSFTPKPPEAVSAVIPASPSVRRFAREIGLDLSEKTGSGPAGRISIDDVKKMAKQILSEKSAGIVPAIAAGPVLPDFSRWGTVRRAPMSKVRTITAEGLSSSWRNVPQVTQFHEANLSLMENFISKHANQVEKAGGKLTVTAILAKLCALALRKYPQFNASVDLENREIIFKEYVNIGIAVDTDRGLLVPVVRDADKKSILEISTEIQEIASRTREKKIKPDELEGGTFTISNLGGIGGTQFTPIVYWPQVAILGVSRSRVVPVFENKKFVPCTMLPVSLSYDHRLIDGADGIRFLDWIVKTIEDPFSALLSGGSNE